MLRYLTKLSLLAIVLILYGCQGDFEDGATTHGIGSKISVYFSKNNSSSYSGGADDKIVDDISNAQQSIYVAIYEITNDKIKNALIDAYERGVEVKVLTDDNNRNDEDMQSLKNAGIDVKDDNNPSSLMHNKFMIVDNNIVWSGSTNYTYYAFYKNYENDVRIVDSKVAKVYKDDFSKMVDHTSKTLELHNTNLDVYFSPEDNIESKMISLIKQAKKSIYFMIFAFTDKNIANSLIEARNRGVKIKGVFDNGFNNSQKQYSKFNYLKDKGIDVALDGNPNKLHDKVMILDDSTVITGSYNWTISANSKNAENSLIIKDKSINKKYKDEFWKIYNHHL